MRSMFSFWAFLRSLSVFLLCCRSASSLDEQEVEVDIMGDFMEDLASTISPLRPVDSLGSIEKLLFEEMGHGGKRNGNAIMLLLVYGNDCKQCADVLVTMEESWWKLNEAITPAHSTHRIPLFGKMDTNLVKQSVVQDELGISKIPSLVFVVGNQLQDGTTFTHAQEYAGKSLTSLEILNTVLHTWYANVVARGELVLLNDEVGTVNPKHFATSADCFEFLKFHSQFYLQRTLVAPALPQTLTREESEYAQWLLGSGGSEGDDFVLLVQCRRQYDSIEEEQVLPELYGLYNSVLGTVSSMRDRLFLSISDCETDGAVSAFHFPRSISIDSEEWSGQLPRITFVPTNHSNDHDDLTTFMTQALTPSMIWFDRQSTAPIAFSRRRKLHAVLFLDLHSLPDTSVPSAIPEHAIHQKEILRQFQSACREYQRRNTDIVKDWVCLVVPSIEHRVLTTFGIDMWSPLDAEAVNVTGSREYVLPSILITDARRGAGLKRYVEGYVDLKKSPTSVVDFFNRFWTGSLNPQVKSSNFVDEVVENEAGVRILTAVDAEATVATRQREAYHSLVMFTSSTCGHCKRFSIIWDQLSSLLKYISWSSFIDLYKFDVETDEIPFSWNVTVRWVPSVYYLPPLGESDRAPTTWKAYDWADIVGDGVGRLSHAVEVLEWLVHTGEFSKEALQQLLDDLPPS